MKTIESIAAAIDSYDVIDERLGDRFNDLIEAMIQRIAADPQLW